MNDNQMRSELSKMYSSEHWKRKVSKMSKNQVFAIYMRTQKNLRIINKEKP